MNDPVGRHPFTVAAWMLVGAVVLATGFGVVGGILSRALVVDLVAMWPLFALILITGVIGWLRSRRRQRRAGAILPLSIFSALILTGALHLGGWDQLPSAEARLTGLPADELSDPARLTAQIQGTLQIRPLVDGVGYRIDPVLRGGRVGVPEATETFVDGALSVRVSAAEAPGWYTFSGWEMGLAPDVRWRLVLNGQLDADFRSIPLESVAVAGSGTIRLGDPPATGAELTVAGDFQVVVPDTAPVSVMGAATTPSEWTATDGATASPEWDPASGGWRILVRGDTPVAVSEG